MTGGGFVETDANVTAVEPGEEPREGRDDTGVRLLGCHLWGPEAGQLQEMEIRAQR